MTLKTLEKINRYGLQWLGLRLAVNDHGHWSLLLGVTPGTGWIGSKEPRFGYFLKHCPVDFHDYP